MKKRFTLLFNALLVSVIVSNAQVNILQGSDMENEDAWMITTLETDPSNSSSYEFAYTDNIPAEGTDGALHYTINNTGANGAHLMFYQEVTIEKGKAYKANMAAKAIQEMNNSWFEVYIGETEPADGADYGGDATALGGFKWSGWEEACADLDLFDGTLQDNGCLEGSNGEFIIEGEGEATMYFGFKAGIWGAEATVEFVVDNIELLDMSATPTAIIANDFVNTKIYPNPVNNTFAISSNGNYNTAKVFNVLGKEVLKINDLTKSVDATSLKAGMYIIELKNTNGNIESVKFQKQ